MSKRNQNIPNSKVVHLRFSLAEYTELELEAFNYSARNHLHVAVSNYIKQLVLSNTHRARWKDESKTNSPQKEAKKL